MSEEEIIYIYDLLLCKAFDLWNVLNKISGLLGTGFLFLFNKLLETYLK